MYEEVTYDLLLKRMLQKALSINGNLDTREGSLVWLGNAPAAVELQNLYIQLDLRTLLCVFTSLFWYGSPTAYRIFSGKPRRFAVDHYPGHLALGLEYPVFHWRTELLCVR